MHSNHIHPMAEVDFLTLFKLFAKKLLCTHEMMAQNSDFFQERTVCGKNRARFGGCSLGDCCLLCGMGAEAHTHFIAGVLLA